MEVNLSSAFIESPHLSSIWWNNGHALRTRVLDALSLIIPAGEKMLVDTLQIWLQAHPQAPTALSAEVKRFIREETSHQRAHHLYNQKMAQYAPSGPVAEKKVAAELSFFENWSLPRRVAVAAALEHITNVFSYEVLRPNNPWLGKGSSTQQRMWVWHAREELGHGHVTTEVLAHTALKRFEFGAIFWACLLYTFMDMLICTKALCADDVRAGRISKGQLLGQGLVLAVQSLPSLARMGWRSLKFLF